MAGSVFVVSIPTAEHEYELEHGVPPPADRDRAHMLTLTEGRLDPKAVPMERVLEGVLHTLEIHHVSWTSDKKKKFLQVVFAVAAGDPTENCLHSLTKLKIGIKQNSVVSVVPANVFMEGCEGAQEDDVDPEDRKAWDGFVDSVRSKLTVKQVVDGVRGGADISFDYVALILTACFIAGIGLIENNAVNIVAAMLISPYMGPVMAITFGTAISDRALQWQGVKGILAGGLIAFVFGLILGLLVGSTENPWGYTDWPTGEMQARGNYRNLWVAVLWSLPSGSGVALALLQGMAGPLIGVAISASLLPPVVNWGLMWGLAATKAIYGSRMRIPHVAGEPLDGSPSHYKFMYTDNIIHELLIMGILSLCLVIINMIFIFVTAIIILKLKEVAAPYTSSPDLRRFWEHDIRVARDFNRMSMRRGASTRRRTSFMLPQKHAEYSSIPRNIAQEDIETLQAAVREAMNDVTLRRVNRCSYHADMASALMGEARRRHPQEQQGQRQGQGQDGELPRLDPELVEQLIASLQLQEHHSDSHAQVSARLSRLGALSRSLRRSGSQRARSNAPAGGAEPQMHMTELGESHGGLPTISERSSARVSWQPR